MRRSHRRLKVVALLLSVGVILLTNFVRTTAASVDSPDMQVKTAWRNANLADTFNFATDLAQTTYPAPSLTNVGRSSRTDSMRIEGNVDRPSETILMSLWNGDGSLLNSSDAIDLRVVRGVAEGRVNGNDWQVMDNVTNAFAPSGDMLGFLAGATNIQRKANTGDVAVSRDLPIVYTFDVNGPALAEHFRVQLEDQLAAKGELPAGVRLDTPNIYYGAIGSGEVWVTSDGYPTRMTVAVDLPEQDNGERITVHFTSRLNGFQSNRVTSLTPDPFMAGLLSIVDSIAATFTPQITLSFVLSFGFVAVGVWVLIRFRRSRRLYRMVALTMIFAMVYSPLWQAGQVYAFTTKQSAQAAQSTANQQAQTQQDDLMQAIYADTWNPHQNPLDLPAQITSTVDSELPVQPEVPLSPELIPSVVRTTYSAAATANDDPATDPKADDDQDGLTNLQETRLGTAIDDADSDGDGISDLIEVTKFSKYGKDWYMNPTLADTNSDGLNDTEECPDRIDHIDFACQDTDGDGTPDVFDYDNDNDGVPDRIDMSPYNVMGTNGLVGGSPYLTPTAFTGDSPMQFRVDGLAPAPDGKGYQTFVDFQIRPTDTKHLWYALNVYDWPNGDTLGQIQRPITDVNGATNTTFATYVPNGGDNNGNGDVRLVPMLEIRMNGNSLPLPMVTPAASQSFEDNTISGTVKLKVSNVSNTQFTFMFSGTANYTATVESGSCLASTPIAANVVTNNGTFTLTNQRVTALANGQNVVRLTNTSSLTATTCFTLIDIPNGSFPDKMVDTSFLMPYGVSIRDLNETTLMAYAPLNLTSDPLGGDRVAFSARMPYWPEDPTNWGNNQEVRVVWLVVLLNPTGGTSVVQTYPDNWTLTGLTVTEDRQVNLAIAFEDPTTDDRPNLDNHLADLKDQLASSWLAARDSNLDDQPDLTVATIRQRFDSTQNGSVSATERWGLPQNAFRVYTYTYPGQDYLAQVMMTETASLLNTHFTSGPGAAVDAPLMLYVYDSTSRQMDTGNGDGLVTANDSLLTLNLDSQKIKPQVTGSINWMPYRHRNGAWQVYPLAEYADKISVDFQALFSTLTEDERIANGVILQGDYLASINGTRRMIKYNGQLQTAISKNDDELETLNKELDPYGAKIKSAVTTLESIYSGEAQQNAINFKNAVNKQFFSPKDGKVKAILAGMQKKKLLVSYLPDTVDKLKKLSNVTKLRSSNARTYGAGLLAGALIATMFIVVSYKSGTSFGVDGAIKLAAAGMATYEVVSAWKAYRAATSGVGTVGKDLLGSVGAAKAAGKAFKGAALGAILSIGISWALAFVSIGLSGASFASGQLLSILASAVAETIVALIMFAIALIPVVGQLIAAIIGAIDAVIAVACAAAGKDFSEKDDFGKRFCKGLSGLVAELIKTFLYSRRSLVNNLKSPNRLEFYDFDLKWVKPELGMVKDAAITLRMGITNTIKLSGILKTGDEWSDTKEDATIPLPFDPLSLPYFWQLTDDNLKGATFYYELQTPQTRHDIHDDLERDTMSSKWQAVSGQDHAFNFGIHVETTTSNVTQQTGINRPLELFLVEGQATPAQQCIGVPVSLWPPIVIPACWIATDKATNPIPLGQSLIYDIMPRTLDGFTALVSKGGGYSLSWGQTGALTFPLQCDADGDGLRSKACGGNDPDDSNWDTDGDGISDVNELRLGYNPTSSDEDGDTLLDADELRLGTNPHRADTDRDGLTDKQEVDGWLFVYDLTSSGQLKSWVTSDPLTADEDIDDLTDVLERSYGFNPHVKSNPSVLTYQSGVIEKAAPRLLWRFENPVNALAFADSSGYSTPGACVSADTCPTSGIVGVYGNAVTFDGVDDLVSGPVSIAANSDLSWAGWIYPENVDTAYHSLFTLHPVGGGQGIGVWIVNQTQLFVILPSGSNYTTGSILTASAWNHLAVVRTGSNYLFYVNGVLRDVTVNATRPAIAQLDLGGADNFYKGRLDEVAVFDRALSASQVISESAGIYNTNDLIVKPSDTLVYTATVKNELLGPFANGLLYTNFPQSVANTSLPPTTFILEPQQQVQLSGVITVSAAAPSGAVTLTQVAEASIQDRNAQSNYAETWLKFDEGAGAVSFSDSSGNVPERNATCVGSECPTIVANGASGNAASFDGSNDVARISGVSLGNSSFTVAFWANRSSFGTDDYAIGAGGNEGLVTDKALHIGFRSSNQFTCAFFGDDLDTSAYNTPNVDSNYWHHWACTYNADTNQRTIYRDGLLVAQGTATGDYQGSGDVLFVGRAPSGGNFHGLLDDLRVFKKVLNSGEIAAISNLPVLHLTFDTATAGSTIIKDTSGRGNDATCYRDGGQCPTLQGGVLGAGPRFYDPSDAATANDFYSVASKPSLNLNDGNFSMLVWISPITTTDAAYDNYPQGLIGYNSGDANTMPFLQRVGLKLRFGFGTASGPISRTTPSSVLTLNKWQQVAVTFDGVTVRFYVDGIEVNAQGLAAKPNASNYQLLIGRSDNNWKVSFPSFYVNDEGADGGPDSEGTLRLNYTDGSLRDYCYTDDWDDGEWHDFSSCWAPPTFDWIPGQSFQQWEEDEGSYSVDNSGDDTLIYSYHLYGMDVNGDKSSYNCNSTCITLYWNISNMDAVAFAGRIDEVAIYKRTLSAAEMLAVFDTVKGGTLFRLDEPPGSKEFNDETGATKLTCTTCPTAGVVGRIGQGTQYVPGQYLSAPWSGGNLEGSVSLWFKTGTPNNGLFSFGTNDRKVWLDGSGHLNALLDAGFGETQVTLNNASQSSTLVGYPANNAIDGNTATFNVVPTSYYAWWQAYLAAGEQTIQTIKITNRIDCCQDALNDITVILYNATGAEAWRSEHLKGDFSVTTISVPLIRASRLRIQRDSNYYLNMAEVKVYTPNSSPLTVSETGANYADNQWHHLLYTFGGAAGGQKIYVDGVSSATSSANRSIQQANNFYLGIAQGLYFYNGYIDQVRLYSRGLTAADATRLYQDVPQALFKLDEAASATTFINAANTGNAFCSTNCPLSGVAGRVGLATEFNGMTNALQINNAAAFNIAGPLAISAWFNAKAWDGSFQRFIAYKQNQYYLWEQGNELRFVVYNIGTITMTVPSLNQWQYVVGNYTGSSLQLWLNGSLAASKSASGTPGTSTFPLFVGSYDAIGDGPFAGTIDELSFYNRYLNGPEINAQYLYQVGLVTERAAYRILIDNDVPTATLRSNTPFVPNTDRLMDIYASDPTSPIRMVQLGSQRYDEGSPQWVGSPVCRDASDSSEWCITFTPRGEGSYTLRPRALDAVGNLFDGPASTIYVDGTGPQITLNALPATVAPAKQNTGWTAAISGTATDPTLPGGAAGSGVVTSTVRVTLINSEGSPAGLGQQQVTVNGNNWRLDYGFLDAEPLGTFTIVAEAVDQVGNTTQSTLGTIRLDSVGSVAALGTSFGIGISSTTQFIGTATEIDMPRSAGLYFPFEEPAGSTAFLDRYAPQNVALGRFATQITTDYGAGPERAVDGNTDGLFSANSVSHTADGTDTNPWWQVDLGLSQSIGRIVLWNRTDCCSTRLTNFYVFISTDPFTSTNPVLTPAQPGVWTTYHAGTIADTSIDFPTVDANGRPVIGRYVRVQLTGTDPLSLAEVQVFSAQLNPGRCSGSSCPTLAQPGFVGNAAQFDGSNDVITATAGFTLANASFSVAFWAKRNSTGSYHIAVGQGIAADNQGLRIGFRDNNVFTCSFFNNDLDSPQSYSDTNWHHWACTYAADTHQRTLYRDGLQINQDTPAVTYQGTGNVSIGSGAWGAPFNGWLDEVAVFNYPLSAAEIRHISQQAVAGAQAVDVSFTQIASGIYNEPPLADQKLYLPLDDRVDKDGKLIFKDLATDRQGICITKCPSVGGVGLRGASAQFDGDDQYVTVQMAEAITGSFTIAAWVRPNPDQLANPIGIMDSIFMTETGAFKLHTGLTDCLSCHSSVQPVDGNHSAPPVTQCSVCHIDENSQPQTKTWCITGSCARKSFNFKFLDGIKLQAKIGDGANWLITTTHIYNYTPGQWYHVAYVVTPAYYELYVNGVPVEANPLSGMPMLVGAGDKLLFGYADGAFTKGWMDDARVFNRALGDAEIRDLYLGSDPVLTLGFENNFADTSPWAWKQSVDQPGADQTPRFVNGGGEVGQSSAAFDGFEDYLNLPSPAYPLANNSFSIGFWAKRAGTGTDQSVLSSGSAGTDQGLFIGFRNTNVFTCAFYGDDLDTPLAYTDTAWHHWVCTYDAAINRRAIYRDGLRVALNTAAADYQGTGAWTIGNSTWLASAFKGELDDLRVYPRALSKAEVFAWNQSNFRAANMTTAGSGVALGQWNATVPIGLEGVYRLDARGQDMNNLSDLSNLGNEQWQGLIDSLAPRIPTSYKANAEGKTLNVFSVEDYNLDLNGFTMSGTCDETGTTQPQVYDANLVTSNQVWYRMGGGEARPYGVTVSCSQAGLDQPALALVACDLLNNCSAATIPSNAANDAVIYAPVNGTVFTSTGIYSITGEATAAIASIQNATFFVDGTPIYTSTYPVDTVTQTAVAANWEVGHTYENLPTTPPAITDFSCGQPITFTVKDAFIVTDIRVGLNISHTYRGDLIITLAAPDATSIYLYNQNGVSAKNIDAWLTDDSAVNVSTDSADHNKAAPYYDNVRQPSGSLSAFQGKAAQGNWVLTICDNGGGDVGMYNRARLSFNATANPAQPVGTPFVSHSYENTPTSPLAIVDGSGSSGSPFCVSPMNLTFDVQDVFTVSDLTVGINLTHSYRRDVYAFLTAPDSTAISLLSTTYDNSYNDYDVQLTDTSDNYADIDNAAHDTAAPYYDNVRRPTDALSGFNGKAAQGNWLLTICDVYAAGTGTFNRAQLNFNKPVEGPHHLQLQVLDWDYALAYSPVITTYLDLYAPAIDFASTILTSSVYAVPSVFFTGPFTETAGVLSVTLQVGDTSVLGRVEGDRWTAAWPVPDVTAPPDGITYPVTVTIVDIGDRMSESYASAIIDILPPVAQPEFFIAGQLANANGRPITSSVTSFPQTGVHTYTLSLPPATDGSGVAGYWSGDTVTPDFYLGGLKFTPYSGSPINVTQLITLPYDGRDVYLHFVTADIYGNQSDLSHQNPVANPGPFYFDNPTAPDYTGMNELAGPYIGGPYRGWMDNGCSYIGQDLRVPFKASKGDVLSSPQKLYATWGTWTPVGVGLRLTWAGADWNRDGDLFIYLDTISDTMPSAGNSFTYIQRGGNVAYNPYPATTDGTLMLLPVAVWNNSVNTSITNWPTLDRMNADYAVWIEDDASMHLLRWNNGTSQWDEVPLPDDAHYNFTAEAGDLPLTEIYLPFSAIGNPTNQTVGLVGFTSEDAGLRVWSTVPSNNPASSQRVMYTAPNYDRPLELAMTDRYTLTLANGQCRQPSYRTYLDITADPGGLPFVSKNDDPRMLWPHFNQAEYASTFSGYDSNYTTWLADFCANVDPSAVECAIPGTFAPETRFAPYIDVNYPPLIPGQIVTYSLHYYNEFPTSQSLLLKLDSSQNSDPTIGGGNTIQWNPAPYSWLSGCTNYLTTTLPANSQGDLTLKGTVLAATRWAGMRVEKSYNRTSCSFTFPNDEPYNSAQVFNPLDTNPPTVSILLPEGLASPLTTTVSGAALDIAPVPTVTLEVTIGGGSPQLVVCLDSTPTDGAWECSFNAKTLNSGTAPANESTITVRAKAADIFNQISAWTSVRSLHVDTLAPSVALGTATQINLADHLIGPAETLFAGLSTDNHLLSSIEVCTPANSCTPAALTIDPATLPKTGFTYENTASALIYDFEDCGFSTNISFNITDTFTVDKLAVGLNLTHLSRGDLQIYLQGPDTTSVYLSLNDGGLASNYDVWLTDDASISVNDDLVTHDATAPYYDNIRQPAQALAAFKGKAAAGTWLLSICDSLAGSGSGTYNRSMLSFTPAYILPVNTQGAWNYTYPFTQSVDGLFQTLNVYGQDSVGNRMTSPTIITFTADNVAPMLAVTQLTTTLNLATIITQPIALTGVVSDGFGIDSVTISSLSPSNQVQLQSVTFPNGGVNLHTPGAVTAWNYTLVPMITGTYKLSVIASDLAGNTVELGTYNVAVTETLASTTLAYSLTLEALGTGTGLITPTIGVGNVVSSTSYSVLFSNVVTLTAMAGPNSTFMGWSGEVVTTTNPLKVRIYGNTNVVAVFDSGETAIANLVATNSGPTSINSSTKLTAMISAGTNVSYTWNFGDGPALSPGPIVLHAYTAVGTYTATVTATNSLGPVIATTKVVIVPYRIYLPLVLKNK